MHGDMTLGRAVRAVRLAGGFKQRELAEVVDVTHMYISHLEADRLVPSVRLLRRISEALNAPPGRILSHRSVGRPGRRSRSRAIPPDFQIACRTSVIVGTAGARRGHYTKARVIMAEFRGLTVAKLATLLDLARWPAEGACGLSRANVYRLVVLPNAYEVLRPRRSPYPELLSLHRDLPQETLLSASLSAIARVMSDGAVWYGP